MTDAPSLASRLSALSPAILSRFAFLRDASVVTIVLAMFVGVVAGVGALVFACWIKAVRTATLDPMLQLDQPGFWLVPLVPVAGLLLVAWLTRRFAPEAQGHGVPEVIAAVARKGGVIRGRVAAFKTLVSGLTIGMGGSVGREGPIVQIGSAAGSLLAQRMHLPERNVKVLVAAGAAAGISATFGAPLAGVMFASEVILGNFAVSSLAPIVVAAVLANLVAQKAFVSVSWFQWVEPDRIRDGVLLPVFNEAREFSFDNAMDLPLYMVLGLVCGLVAVGFTRALYWTEDVFLRYVPKWQLRAVVGGLIVGGCALHPDLRSLFGVGYEAINDALAVKTMADVKLSMAFLLVLLALKVVTTSVSLAGGGSGGIFAPSLFLGAVAGGIAGQVSATLFPGMEIQPGAFSIVGMAAVVAGTTHGPISAVLILFEMTQDYNMILPLLCAAGLASVVARAVDPESIYLKKLSRRGELTAWGHHTTSLEDIYVRDLMITDFPTVNEAASLTDIVQVAMKNPKAENIPVMGENGQLLGIICTEELHRMLDSDMQPQLVRALDIVRSTPTRVTPDENLLDALQGFGDAEGIESLPVVKHIGGEAKLVGLLPRITAMRRYRQEMLRHHSGQKK